jgi:RNA polymerase sigma-70 factor (ECF subfamily)
VELKLCHALASLVDAGQPRPAPSRDLERALAAALASARATWPGVAIDDAVFLRFLARHLPADGTASALARLHTSDMFLAAACVAGDARALEHFERDLLSAGSPALARLRLPADVVEEARQVLRHRFFIGRGDAPPKILDYAGTGALRGWVRAAVTRAALRVMRAPKGRVETDYATIAAVTSPASDLELDYLKRRYGTAASAALDAAFARIAARDRNLLRQHFALGLGIDEIAALYQVLRSTAARWVIKAREKLAAKTREAMAARLKLADDEVSSILRLIQSQLEERMRSLFAAPASS